MPSYPVVRIKNPVAFSHPWIFQKMVERPARRLNPGTIVEIVDREDQFLGRGIYNGHSTIALRFLTQNADEPIDGVFFAQKIDTAVQLRRELLKLDEVTDAYRLIHAEGDGISGLVVDRFGDTLVIEFFSAGLIPFRAAIESALRNHFPGARTYAFMDEHTQAQESVTYKDETPPPPGIITEHGVKFRVAPGYKHKTGFFADQRENRRELARYTAGARVLDLCCNTGGFAVYAKTIGQAADVVAVDLDEDAIAQARQNAELNGLRMKGGKGQRPDIRFVHADLFPWLRDADQNGERFDVVILDPAKLTRSRLEVINALKKYLDMNKLAMSVVKPGGVFVTCSCTGLVSEEQFLEMLKRAAHYAGRTLQIFRVAGAGPDHPFLAHVPEGRYLKAVFCRVF